MPALKLARLFNYKLKKVFISGIVLSLIASLILDTCCYGLATLPASRNPIARREIEAALRTAQKGIAQDENERRRFSDLIYEWYRDMKLKEHERELRDLGTSSLEIKNMLKNLIRNRFAKLLREMPEGSIRFLGAGEKFIAFELGDSGLVIKIPVMGCEYFRQIEPSLRNLRLKLGDRLPETIEYIEDIKVNPSKFDPAARRILLGRISDDVLNLRRDADYVPITDPNGDVDVYWLLVQKKVDRLVDSDNFLYDGEYYKGFLETTYRKHGKEGVKRIIDDLFDLLRRDAYPRGVYPKEIKFSSFGYLGGRLMLFDIDLKGHEPEIENSFTTGILNILDPTRELSDYYRSKLSSVPGAINAVPVLAGDLDFMADGKNTKIAQKEAINELLEHKVKNPPYSMSKDFDNRILDGKNPREALEDVLAKFNIGLKFSVDDINTENVYCRVIIEALNIIPSRLLDKIANAGFKAINISANLDKKDLLKFDNGIIYIHPEALQRLGGEAFVYELYRHIGLIFVSASEKQNIAELSKAFDDIKMRGRFILEESRKKGYDFIEVKKGEDLMSYVARLFTYYLMTGDRFREIVNGDSAYEVPYSTIRPSIRKLYDHFKFRFDWKEYDHMDLEDLYSVLTQSENGGFKEIADEKFRKLLVIDSASEITGVGLIGKEIYIVNRIAAAIKRRLPDNGDKHIINILNDVLSEEVNPDARKAIAGLMSELKNENGEFDYQNLAYQAVVSVVRSWPKKHHHAHIGNSIHEGFVWNEMVLYNRQIFGEFKKAIKAGNMSSAEEGSRVDRLSGQIESGRLWHCLPVNIKQEISELFSKFGLRRDIGVYDLASWQRAVTHVALQHFADGVTDLRLLININKKFEPDRAKVIRAAINGLAEAERLAQAQYGRRFTVKLVASFARNDIKNSPQEVEQAVDELIGLRNTDEAYKDRIIGIDISGAEAIIDTNLNTHFRKTSDYKHVLEKAAANGMTTMSHLGDWGHTYKATQGMPDRSTGENRVMELADVSDREERVKQHLNFMDDGIRNSGPLNAVLHGTVLAPKGSIITKGPKKGNSSTGESIEDAANLDKIEELLRCLREGDVEIQTCPTSNANTNKVARYRGHPLYQWILRGNRVSINADDLYWGNVPTTLSDDIAKMILAAPEQNKIPILSITKAMEISKGTDASVAEEGGWALLDKFEGITIFESRKVAVNSGAGKEAEKLADLLRQALIHSGKVVPKGGPPVHVHVLPSLRSNVKKHIAKNGDIHLLLSELFVNTLLLFREQYPNAIPWLFAERIAHELSHSNTMGTDAEERLEEIDILINCNLVLYRMLIADPGLKREVDSFFDETGIKLGTRRLYKELFEQIVNKSPGEILRAVEIFVDEHYNFMAKSFPSDELETGTATLPISISAPLSVIEDQEIKEGRKGRTIREAMIDAAQGKLKAFDRIHFDIRTQKFIDHLKAEHREVDVAPNIGLFNEQLIREIRSAAGDIPIDVHLMDRHSSAEFIRKLAGAGASTIAVHLYAFDGKDDLIKNLLLIKRLGLEAGVVLSIWESPENIDKEVLKICDFVIVSSVPETKIGGAFDTKVLNKIRTLRGRGYAKPIQVQGGINDLTISDPAFFGANVFVSGSFAIKDDLEKTRESVSILRRKAAESAAWSPIRELGGKILVNKTTGRIRYADDTGIVDSRVALWAARHGQTHGNLIEGFVQGAVDKPVNQLTEEGWRQAEIAAENLFKKFEARIISGEDIVVVTSMFSRAKNTAAVFADLVRRRTGRNITVIEDELANEKASGAIDNKALADMSPAELTVYVDKYRKGRDATARLEGGESYIDVLIRARKLLDKLNSLYEGKTVILFGHAAHISAIQVLLGDRALVDEDGLIDWRKNKIYNGQVMLLSDIAGSRAVSSEYEVTLKETGVPDLTRNELIDAVKAIIEIAEKANAVEGIKELVARRKREIEPVYNNAPMDESKRYDNNRVVATTERIAQYDFFAFENMEKGRKQGVINYFIYGGVIKTIDEARAYISARGYKGELSSIRFIDKRGLSYKDIVKKMQDETGMKECDIGVRAVEGELGLPEEDKETSLPGTLLEASRILMNGREIYAAFNSYQTLLEIMSRREGGKAMAADILNIPAVTDGPLNGLYKYLPRTIPLDYEKEISSHINAIEVIRAAA